MNFAHEGFDSLERRYKHLGERIKQLEQDKKELIVLHTLETGELRKTIAELKKELTGLEPSTLSLDNERLKLALQRARTENEILRATSDQPPRSDVARSENKSGSKSSKDNFQVHAESTNSVLQTYGSHDGLNLLFAAAGRNGDIEHHRADSSSNLQLPNMGHGSTSSSQTDFAAQQRNNGKRAKARDSPFAVRKRPEKLSPPSPLYMRYTISRDESGSADSQKTSKLLAIKDRNLSIISRSRRIPKPLQSR